MTYNVYDLTEEDEGYSDSYERLMLGHNGTASLLVEVRKRFSETDFIFHVINGAWDGRYVDGRIFLDIDVRVREMDPVTYVLQENAEYIDGYEIVSDDQKLLRVGDSYYRSQDYNDIFNDYEKSRVK
jgi:hypothetical protein